MIVNTNEFYETMSKLEEQLDTMFDKNRSHTAKYKKLEARLLKLQRESQLDDLPSH